MTYLATKKALNRRSFLKGSGVTVALPLLHAMTPAFTRAGAFLVIAQTLRRDERQLGFSCPLSLS